MSKPDLKTALASIQKEESLDDNWLSRCHEAINQQALTTPWYVKAMLGFSAWLAMVFIIIFLFASRLIRSEEAAIIFGIILIPLACLIRNKSNHEFQKQMALAISMAGQTLLYLGILVATKNSRDSDGAMTAAVIAIIVSSVLIKIYPDKIHRFLSTVILITAMVVIETRLHQPILFNVLPMMIGALAIYLTTHEISLLQKSWSDIVRPVQYGLLFGLMLICLPSSSYLIREVILHSHYYLSTIGIGLALLYLEYHILKKMGYTLTEKTSLLITGSTIIFIIATLQAPGITASFLVILLGFSSGDKVLQGTGIAFMAWYISSYYYSMNISLLEKSISLVATGIILLLTRKLLRRLRASHA